MSPSQFVPHFERPMEQRNITRMFEVGTTDDARLTMRTSPIMGRSEAINSQHRPAQLGRFTQRCTADSTKSDHDAVVTLHCLGSDPK